MRRTIQRFVVVGELGRGGMGVVYRARDPQLEREVAIKLLERPVGQPGALTTHATIDLRADAAPRDDLLAEARMMARLSHPNVLPIYEVGLEGDHVFLVMELVDGTNLRAWLGTPRTRAEILDVLAQAARGLAAAHARGIIHRDFKPDNVLIGSDGRARVADFGLAGLVVASTFVHAGDGRGTPRYMAPELWQDQPATAASDVFALCRTIADALGEDSMPDALRDRVLAGLDDDPARRPALDAVIAELREPVPVARTKRWRLWGVVAAGAAAGALALAAAARSSRSACDDDPVLDGLWDPQAREALTGTLATASRPAVTHLLATIDERASHVLKLRRDVCEARERGELGDQPAAIQMSCLERRAVELGLDLRRAIAHPDAWPIASIEDALFQAPQPAVCGDDKAPPIKLDRPSLVALWGRLIDAPKRSPAEEIAAIRAIERDATAADEAELALRAQVLLAEDLRVGNQLDEADRVFERAYAGAVAMGSTQLQAAVLSRRSKLAADMGKPAAAESYAKLAFALVDRPTLHPVTRVRIYMVLALAELERGEMKAVLPLVEKGRELIAKSGHPMDDLELRLRLPQFAARLDLEGASPGVIALARDNVEWTRSHFGEGNYHAVALSDLATALAESGDATAALELRRKALAIQTKLFGPMDADVLRSRERLGTDLDALGQFEEARAELSAVLAACDTVEAARPDRPSVLGHLAQATFNLGRFDEGIELMQRSVEDFTSQLGADHARTLYKRGALIDLLLEVGRLDEAGHQLASIEASQQRAPQAAASYLLGLYRPQLLRWRGKLGDAEAAARAALAESGETKRPVLERSYLLWSFGMVLVAEKRWSEARAPLEESIAILERQKAPAQDLAETQVVLAEATLGLGDRARAKELASTAASALERFPGHIRARKRAAALLATLR